MYLLGGIVATRKEKPLMLDGQKGRRQLGVPDDRCKKVGTCLGDGNGNGQDE
jgi:hypothetical protein